jgi:4-amino-4-deoxy-L-arabinose transferase-like glycosyltransferase
MRKRGAIIPLYFLAYCAVLLLYPYKLTRFFMPVEPLVLMATLTGVMVVFRRKAPVAGALLAAVIGLTLVMTSAPGAWQMAQSLKDCDRETAMTSPACFAPDRLAFFEATRYAREALPPGTGVVTIKEATFYYYSGHTVMHSDLAMQRGRDDVIGFVRGRGIEYVLVTPFVGGAEIVKPLLPVCERVELVRNFGNRTILLKLHDSPESVPQNACANFQNIQRQILEEEQPQDDEDAL